MDILSIIKSEHREVAKLIDEVQKIEPDDERLREITAEIEQKLSMHLAIEERLFYSTLRKRAEDSKEEVDVYEAYTEHDVAKHLIDLLRKGRQTPELFKAEVQVLGESVKRHVQEEESKVFKIAHQVIDTAELEELGKKWEAAKKRAQSTSANTNGQQPTTRKRKAA